MHPRQALITALLPELTPAVDDVQFWARFDARAPLPLRLATHVTAWVVVVVLPRIQPPFRSWSGLRPAARDAIVRRAAALPGLGDGLELSKMVACFAAFHETAIATRLREPTS